jgi:hypothetical protein
MQICRSFGPRDKRSTVISSVFEKHFRRLGNACAGVAEPLIAQPRSGASFAITAMIMTVASAANRV